MKTKEMTTIEAKRLVDTERGQKDIWLDRETFHVFFCDYEDLPKILFPEQTYVELSYRELQLMEDFDY